MLLYGILGLVGLDLLETFSYFAFLHFLISSPEQLVLSLFLSDLSLSCYVP